MQNTGATHVSSTGRMPKKPVPTSKYWNWNHTEWKTNGAGQGMVQTSCHHECFGASLNPLPNLASRSTICIDFNDTNLEQTHWSTLPGCDKESEIVQPFQSSHSPPKLVLKTGIKNL